MAKTEADIISDFLSRLEGLARLNSDTRPRLQLRVVIPLDVAATSSNPYKIAGIFNGFYVEGATDTITQVQLGLSSPETHNLANYTNIKINDSCEFDQPIKDIYLMWSAQTGKTITIVFYFGVNFKPGSQLSVTSGGVSITEGSTLTATNFSVGTTASQLLTFDSSRLAVTVQNQGGTPIYIGATSGVTAGGASGGLLLGAGSTVKFNNTTALWALTEFTTNSSIYTFVEK